MSLARQQIVRRIDFKPWRNSKSIFSHLFGNLELAVFQCNIFGLKPPRLLLSALVFGVKLCPLKKKVPWKNQCCFTVFWKQQLSGYCATDMPVPGGLKVSQGLMAIRSGHMGQGVRCPQPSLVEGRQQVPPRWMLLACLGTSTAPFCSRTKDILARYPVFLPRKCLLSELPLAFFWHLGLVMCYFLTQVHCLSLGVQMLVTSPAAPWWMVASCRVSVSPQQLTALPSTSLGVPLFSSSSPWLLIQTSAKCFPSLLPISCHLFHYSEWQSWQSPSAVLTADRVGRVSQDLSALPEQPFIVTCEFSHMQYM